MLRVWVKVGAIDMFGFCGRDFHPKATDSHGEFELIHTDLARFREDPIPEDVDVLVLRTPDGRDIEVVEDEVESMRFEKVYEEGEEGNVETLAFERMGERYAAVEPEPDES